ncbi:MAG: hypothetical protein F9K40_19775 [Kofleriaceae bacterium]|nr:MAG: hypothetical protein F9K40_19775 [Kofleriaceae bacterium]MBZ0233931.1 hypothetical protein [Kofleriaceae bacterium]
MSGTRLFASLTLALGACATADPGGGNNGNVDAPGGSEVDAPGGGDPDAPGSTVDAPMTPIDAPPGNIDAALQTITLSQSGAMTITALNSVSCNAAGITAENSYYRVFRLSDFGVVRPFTAQRIDFGVESADAEVGTSQTVQVRLYTLNGTFITTNLTSVAGQLVTVNDTTAGIVLPVALSPAPVIQPTETLVAELFVPDSDADGNGAGNIFFIGSNTTAETGPSYIRAPDCAITQPATVDSINFPDMHVVLTVTGVF